MLQSFSHYLLNNNGLLKSQKNIRKLLSQIKTTIIISYWLWVGLPRSVMLIIY